ncbi:hypothetical protein COU20_00285 [Candidatus Kaiserbacteria bacterium CG10_big_fil_rev_8_21_14_0_10_59_10]|uniref:Uncharacterized protein n=1 Tax=Candidatus Kaiserbacteria bacterium CG10_big_fil_rev_8_21_14_0_10_59_10 TaxID=1974612 RepID=A0A2H0U8Y3_9BACT|nr:MAG: hypothetical protein COU20_00285 [Candidatus Kaiserbacteria bacterium CG10_big_fil_rev_8_21_14_0_10_59_10]
MFGITFLELVLFGQQFGLALAGAASLWGFVFILKGTRYHHGDTCVTFDWLARKLLYLLYAGAAIAILSWAVLLMAMPAYAHEGIVIVPELAERTAALKLTTPVFVAWMLLLLPLGLLSHVTPAQFHRRLTLFYAVHFAVILFLISIPAWTGSMSLRQFFFIGHSAHSIFTLGTVLVLDFLFLISKSSLHLKRHIYPLFPTISKVILVGLGIDFLSVALVFSEAIALTPKFFFMQTIVGILLINGSLLAGPLTRRLIAAAKSGSGKLGRRWEFLGDVAGTISITSWFTITFVDYFAELSLGYGGLLLIYACVLFAAIAVHLVWTRTHRDPVSEQLFAWHRSGGYTG